MERTWRVRRTVLQPAKTTKPADTAKGSPVHRKNRQACAKRVQQARTKTRASTKNQIELPKRNVGQVCTLMAMLQKKGHASHALTGRI